MISDPYTCNKACINRLVDDYSTHGKLVVAFDFDNTISDYHNIGYSFDRVINLLKACENNHHLVCFTANKDEEMVSSYIEKTIGIVNFTINESPVDTGGRKIYYNILLDDRAGLESAVYQLEKFISVTEEGN